MEDRKLRLSRRKFLRQAAVMTLASGLPHAPRATAHESTSLFRARPPRPSRDGRKPIAIITTVYRPLSHADHIGGRFIHGYVRDGRFHVPGSYVSSMYIDQVPDNDLSRDLAKEFDFRLYRSIVPCRRPELEVALQSPLPEALVAAHGPIEVYGFHALETLQVMLERRRGGETGVKAVTCLTGNDVWKAGDAGLWSWELLEAALGRSETLNVGDIRRNTGSISVGTMPRTPPTAFLVEYRDGLRGTIL